MNIWYMNGAGNDFMVMDGRGLNPDYSSLAKKLCAITGADGFMAVDDSENADFKLHFYNSLNSRNGRWYSFTVSFLALDNILTDITYATEVGIMSKVKMQRFTNELKHFIGMFVLSSLIRDYRIEVIGNNTLISIICHCLKHVGNSYSIILTCVFKNGKRIGSRANQRIVIFGISVVLRPRNYTEVQSAAVEFHRTL